MANARGKQIKAVLIQRDIGGLGDVIVHRQIFQDVRASYGLPLHFACPTHYHPVVEGHPYVDALVDSAKVNPRDYAIAFNTSSICNDFEQSAGHPRNYLPRAQIWASHCGLTLANTSFHFTIPTFQLPSQTVLIAPRSACSYKSLTTHQIAALVELLERKGLEPLCLHDEAIRAEVPQVHGLSLKMWMRLIASAPRVISVDTAALHMAGAMGIPLVGLHSMFCGKVIGHYYEQSIFQADKMSELDLEAVAEAASILPEEGH